MNLSSSRAVLGLLTAAVAVGLSSLAPAQDVAWAYVNPNGQGPSWQPSTAYQHTPSGESVTITRVGGTQHRFRVRFPAMAPSGGVVHATALGGNHTAVVNEWSQVSDNIDVDVSLFGPAGAPANDGKLSVMFRRGGEGDQRQAYLWASDESAQSYTPSPTYSWNGNRSDPTIQRTGIGSYSVLLPGLGNSAGERGSFQVTPYLYPAAPMRAKVIGWSHNGSDLYAQVLCQNMDGNPTDGKFTLSYNETAAPIAGIDGSGAHVWANEPTSSNYTPDTRYMDSNGTFGPGESESIARLGVGSYQVKLPNLVSAASSTVQATAYGAGDEYATVTNWGSLPCGGSKVNVKTFDADGIPSDARFTLLYLTNRPVVSQDVAWAYVDPAGEGASWTPDSLYQHSSSGGTVTVDRDPAQLNRFIMTFPQVQADGVPLVSAHGGNHTAVINGWSQLGDDVRVAVELFEANGSPADNKRFMVEYRRGGNNRNREAYLYAGNATSPAYTPSTYYSWNANREDPTITHGNTGIYAVRIPGIATSVGNERGNVQVTPYDGNMLRTSVSGWQSNGDDVVITVRCYDQNGALKNGRFTLTYNETAAPISIHEGSGAHVWANNAFAASYTPVDEYTDSNGTFGPANAETIERVGTGRYRVLLPNVVSNASATAQVTAFGTGGTYASVQFWNGLSVTTGTQVYVTTFDASGSPADSEFTLRYLTDRPATGEAASVTKSYGNGCHGLLLESLNRPVSCSTWNLGLSGLPGSTLVGIVQLDLVDANVPMAAIGAPGCSLYTSGAFTAAILPPIPNPVYSFDIPANPVFIGLSIFAQAGVLAPGVNALGIASSNGVEGVVGDI